MYSTTEIAASSKAVQPTASPAVSGREDTVSDILVAFSDALRLDQDAPLYLLRKLRDSVLQRVTVGLANISAIRKVLQEFSVVSAETSADYSKLTKHLGSVRDSEDAYSTTRQISHSIKSIDSALATLDKAGPSGVRYGKNEAYQAVKVELESLSKVWEEMKSFQSRFETVLTSASITYHPATQAQASKGLSRIEAAKGRQGTANANPREVSSDLLALKGSLKSRLSVPDPLSAKFSGSATPTGVVAPAKTPESTVSGPYIIESGSTLEVTADGGSPNVWTLPTATTAELLSVIPPALMTVNASGTYARFLVDGYLVIAEILTTPTYLTPSDMADMLVAAGIVAEEVSGRLAVRSSSSGSTGSVEVTDAANWPTVTIVGPGTVVPLYAALGWAEGSSARGTSVSLGDLLRGMGRYGVPYSVPDTLTRRESLKSVSASGTTNVTFGRANAGTAPGDTLHIEGVGDYSVVSAGAYNAGLNKAPPTGNRDGRSFRHTLRLQSKATSATSKLVVSATDGATALGIAQGTYYGSAKQFALDSTPSVEIRSGDIFSGSTDVSIQSVNGTTVTLSAEAPTSETLSTIYALGAVKYPVAVAAVSSWRSSGGVWKGTGVLISKTLKALTGAIPVDGVLAELATAEAAVTDLKTAMSEYDAAVVTSMDASLAAMKGRGLDRLYDLIITGDISGAYAVTSDTASYRGYAQAAMSSAGADFPLPDGVDLSDVMEDSISSSSVSASYTAEKTPRTRTPST